MSESIKETKELFEAIKSISLRTIKNLAGDHTISFGEKIGYVNEFSNVCDAFYDIGRIPAELADLNSDEMKELKLFIVEGLREAGFTERTNDMADWTLDMIYYNVQYALKMKNAPPTAEKV